MKNSSQDMISSELFKRVTENIDECVVLYKAYNEGEDFIFLEINTNVAITEKLTRDEIIGKRITELFPGAKSSGILGAFQESFQNRTKKTLSNILYQDEIRTGYRTNIIEFIEPDLLLVVYRDESEIERMRRFSEIVINEIDTVIFTSFNGEKLESCNNYFLKIFGYENLEDFHKEHDCACDFFIEDVDKNYIGSMVGEQRWVEYVLAFQDKKIVKTKIKTIYGPRIYSIRIQKFIFDNANKYLVILNDITLQENYETTLLGEIDKHTGRIENLYELLSASEKINKFGVMEISIQKERENWSDGIYEILDDKKKVTLPALENFLSFVDVTQKNEAEARFSIALKREEFESFEVDIISAKEIRKPIRFSGEFIYKNQKAKRLVIVVQDISKELALKDLEKEHQALKIEQQQLASLREMFKNISHHWRQPLNIIGLQTEALFYLHEAGELTPEKIAETEETVHREIKYLSETISHFREIALESIGVTNFSINQKLTQVLKILERKIKKYWITVDIEGEELKYIGAESELLRVFYGIIHNSIEAIAQKMEKIEKRYDATITIAIQEKKKSIEISIRDNGIGIDKKIADSIFEPYFTTKFQARGVGLSLTTAQHTISESFNGRIYLNKKFKEGTEFIIELPKK